MANACGLFGDLIPNVYIDRVTLEESQTDTNSDGVVDLQTPKVSVQLKVLDSESSGGNNLCVKGNPCACSDISSLMDLAHFSECRTEYRLLNSKYSTSTGLCKNSWILSGL